MNKFEKINEKLIPEVNIGTLGHVDHGKSSMVEALTGKWPAIHSEELKRGITIKLGYADATVYKCGKCGCYWMSESCSNCSEKCEPQRTISFVDAPGHETLMATVLTGANLMDGIMFIIAANEKCPQPQTKEHLMVLEIVGIKNIVIVQTKIDIVTKEQALENYRQIKEFVKGTIAENAPIIPVSAKQNVNLDSLLRAIEENVPTPQREISKPPKMLVVRSFDVNRPGAEIEKIKGGILGGGLVQGKLRLGDEIEIRPGVFANNKWNILKTKVAGLQKAGKDIEEAGPGGLLGVLTELDNFLTKADLLAGSVAGRELPPVLHKLTVKFNLFEKVIEEKIDPIRKDEQLMMNVGVSRSLGVVKSIKNQRCEFDLKIPVCAEKGERVVLSRRIEERWRLIGWGFVE